MPVPSPAWLGPSRFIGPGHLERLQLVCVASGIDATLVAHETDSRTDMEGLYLKVEEDSIVEERYKFVRAAFLTSVLNAESHWLDRPIVPNGLLPGVDLYAPSLLETSR